MISLHGFTFSNYYNKVKLVLLEKGLPFVEVAVTPGARDEAVLAASPLGKVPYIRDDRGTLCESQVICEYLERRYPEPALMPADPFEAAKVRELITFIELHLELVARRLYPQAFFGAAVSAEVQDQVRRQLGRGIPAFQRLARFAPYVAGAAYTLADCSAWTCLPAVGMATLNVLGTDLLLEAGIDWKAHAALIGARPGAVRVAADRRAGARP
ncbi:MAG: glutathione S-transferase [Burkholderiales bacterium]|nr:glutathione S-transferase family protein [Burkholderiales bacterium]MDE1928460.1 glutathione S-transferase [Burkholderiales bacterium]MDE2159764.1 glutathione S-transferase [Burkholderiales bacterium]MDE2502819.1 glutathione S-transferase [Burkholderiales bacterium]